MLRPHTLLTLVLAAASLGEARAVDGFGASISDYQQARRVFWRELYAGGGETLYCETRFGSRKGKSLNVEHVLPMSWVARHLRCGERDECRRDSALFNRIEADLHNLWPALTKVNKARR
jgi:deoxyribonuclease-1